MTTPGIFFDKSGRKTFIPLENNPDVFSHLVHSLGLSPDLGFYDVYSIDESDLLAMVPRPVHALIFIAPAPVYYRVRETDEKPDKPYAGSGESEPVMWFKQTIGHACGLIALLHSISNGTAKDFIIPGSDIDNLLKDATYLEPAPRANLLYNSQELERAHMAAAIRGDTVAPSSEDPIGYHFISFVKGRDGHLWELEGSWNGPIDRGMLGEDQDLLCDEALDLGVRRFTKAADGNLEFSIVALATKPDATS
jgi:ubiquitin carboxyl-terminal hydrolase L3